MNKLHKQLLSYLNLFYIALSIIWVPLHIYILKVDAAGRTINIFTFIVLLANFRNILVLFKDSRAVRVWSILVFYSIINNLVKGYDFGDNTPFLFFAKNYYNPFMLLLVAAIEMRENKYRCLTVVAMAFLFYIFVDAPHIAMDLDGRLLSKTGNSLSLNCVVCLFVFSLFLVEEKIRWPLYIAVALVCAAIIIASGTRKAMGAAVIVFIGVVLSKFMKQTFWAYFLLLVSVVVLYWGVNYVMNNTVVGERFEYASELDVVDVRLVQNERINDFFLFVLGDRAIQYEQALEVYHEHPVTGIGIDNFTTYYTPSLLRLHTEYMVQLCENGMVGFVLLMLFYTVLIVGLIRNWNKDNPQKTIIVLFGLFVVLFINLTTWTYCQTYIMILYAIIVSYTIADRKETETNYNQTNENSSPSSREQFQRTLDQLFPKAPDRI